MPEGDVLCRCGSVLGPVSLNEHFDSAPPGNEYRVRCNKCGAVATKRYGKLHFLSRQERKVMQKTWKGIEWKSVSSMDAKSKVDEPANESALPPFDNIDFLSSKEESTDG